MWLLPQVRWEGAAGSAWMRRGGKPMGTTSAVLPRTGAHILVGMAGLGLETRKLEKGICAFPRKLGLAMGGLGEGEVRAGSPVRLKGLCGAGGKRREASRKEEAWRSEAADE